MFLAPEAGSGRARKLPEAPWIHDSENDVVGSLAEAHNSELDQTEIEVITKWPRPTTTRAVHGFFGLSSYYRKFIKGYGLLLLHQHSY
ncbi:unnamed protein product [Microthlaspi erraticum]|uniref:Reverse transcriptase/retrotransposon-derived protein RNase H-like domain-containing protein n=1 Tax=Microthlaspi erraticum TaxID=1685480 RepID=A0A6D2LKX8_9BRAS|nr:unnamed protein product [Microthlaspi erraticum]